METIDISELARLYDLATASLDPTCDESHLALKQFNHTIDRIFNQASEPGVDSRLFRRQVIIKCREYLRRENQKPRI